MNSVDSSRIPIRQKFEKIDAENFAKYLRIGLLYDSKPIIKVLEDFKKFFDYNNFITRMLIILIKNFIKFKIIIFINSFDFEVKKLLTQVSRKILPSPMFLKDVF